MADFSSMSFQFITGSSSIAPLPTINETISTTIDIENTILSYLAKGSNVPSQVHYNQLDSFLDYFFLASTSNLQRSLSTQFFKSHVQQHLFSVHSIIAGMINRIDIKSNFQAWGDCIKFIGEYQELVDFETRRSYIKKITSQIQGLGNNRLLSKEVVESANSALSIIDLWVSPPIDTSPRFPPYLVYVDVRSSVQLKEDSESNASESVNENYNLHWLLLPWLHRYLVRIARLSSLLTLNGWSDVVRLIGFSRCEYEDILIQNTPHEHQIVETLPLKEWGSNSYQKYVQSIVHLLCQGATIEVINSHLQDPKTSKLKKGELYSSQTHINKATSNVLYGPISHSSQILIDALIQRMSLLATNTTYLSSIKNLTEMILSQWGEWQTLADQIYSFVEVGVLPFDIFVLALGAHKPTLKDNSIVWLLSQLTPMETVLELFLKDLQTRNDPHLGFMLKSTFDLQNTNVGFKNYVSQDLSQCTLIRDTGFLHIIYRIATTVSKNPKSVPNWNDVNRYVEKLNRSVDSVNLLSTKLNEFKNLWQRLKEKDFYNMNEQQQISMSVLSCHSSSPLSEEMFDFLCSPEKEGSHQNMGKARPISIYILGSLSIRLRLKLIEHLEQVLFAKVNPPALPNPLVPPPTPNCAPAVLETFCRLIYLTPCARPSRFRLHLNLRDGGTKFHILLELIGYRLLRLFSHMRELRKLFYDSHDWITRLGNTAQHQLYRSVECFLIRLSNVLDETLKFGKNYSEVNVGPIVNRLLVLSLARTLKVNGFSEFSKISEIPLLLERLFNLTGHNWSKNTIRYFPEPIKSFYNEISSHYPHGVPSHQAPTQNATPPQLQAVTLETIQTHNTILASLEKNVNQYSQYYQNPQYQNYLLPVMWLHQKEAAKYVPYVSYVLTTLPAMDCTRLIYSFIDFLFDEILQAPAMSTRPMGSRRDAQPMEKIREVGVLLSQYIFGWHLLSLEGTLLAISDRDDDPNSFLLLEYLLIESHEIRQRVEEFKNIMTPFVNFWTEDNFYNTNSDFNMKFNEHVPQNAHPSGPKSQPSLPIYYSNSILRLLSILMFIMGRIIENSKGALLAKIIDIYSPVYALYEMPVTQLYNLMYYYYDAPIFTENSSEFSGAAIKRKLTQFLSHLKNPSNSSFKMFIEKGHCDAFSLRKYFEGLISKVETYISPAQIAKIPKKKPLDFFKEFPSSTRETLILSSLELLLLPTTAKEISQNLLNFLEPPDMSFPNNSQLNYPPSFNLISSIAIIFSLLPESCHELLFEYSITTIKNSDSSVIVGNSGYIYECTTPRDFMDYSANINCNLDTNVNRVILLLQHFFHFGSASLLQVYPSFVQAFKPLNSVRGLLVLTKIIAPFIYRLSSNPDLLWTIILELFNRLNEVDLFLSNTVFLRPYPYPFFNPTPNDFTSPLTYLEEFRDFVFHCKSVVRNGNENTMELIRRSISTLGTNQKALFGNLF